MAKEKKDNRALMHVMSKEKRAKAASKERITARDYGFDVPITNASMREPYVPNELNYRGKK